MKKSLVFSTGLALLAAAQLLTSCMSSEKKSDGAVVQTEVSDSEKTKICLAKGDRDACGRALVVALEDKDPKAFENMFNQVCKKWSSIYVCKTYEVTNYPLRGSKEQMQQRAREWNFKEGRELFRVHKKGQSFQIPGIAKAYFWEERKDYDQETGIVIKAPPKSVRAADKSTTKNAPKKSKM